MGTQTPAPCTILNEDFPLLANVESVRKAYVEPLSSLDNNGPIRYSIPTSDRELILPNKTMHEITISMVVNGVEEIDVTKDFAIPVNSICSSLFKGIETTLNGVSVTNSTTGMYPYRAEIENRVMTDEAEKTNQLLCAGYHRMPGEQSVGDIEPEAVKKIYDVDDHEGVPESCHQFAKRFIEKKCVTLCDKIHDDLFVLNKCLPPCSQITVTFDRAEPEFYMISRGAQAANDRKVSIKIHKSRLIVCYVTLNDSSMRRINETREFNYHFPSTKMSYFSAPGSVNDIVQNNMLNGILPTACLLCMVDAKSFSGEYGKDPFVFPDFKATRVTLVTNGAKNPTMTLELNAYDKDRINVTGAVMALLEFSGVDSGINMYNYANGNVFFPFLISPAASLSDCAGSFVERPNYGQIDTKIQLDGTGVTDAIIYIAYTPIDYQLKITQGSEVGSGVKIIAPEIRG